MSTFQLLDQDDPFIRLYKFTCLLPPDESYMLNYLIDAERYVKARLVEDPDYFMCCADGFVNNLLTGWSVYQIRKAQDKLQKKGLIEIKIEYIGNKCARWIKLNSQNVMSLKKLYDSQRKENEEVRVHDSKVVYMLPTIVDVSKACKAADEKRLQEDFKKWPWQK